MVLHIVFARMPVSRACQSRTAVQSLQNFIERTRHPEYHWIICRIVTALKVEVEHLGVLHGTGHGHNGEAPSMAFSVTASQLTALQREHKGSNGNVPPYDSDDSIQTHALDHHDVCRRGRPVLLTSFVDPAWLGRYCVPASVLLRVPRLP
jgi:hypothetical protein